MPKRATDLVAFPLITSLAACGPSATANASHPGLVAAREGASSGGMSRVVASDIPPPGTGSYPAEVTAAPEEGSAEGSAPAALPRPPAPIALGATVRGQLEQGDPAYPGGDARVDDYAFVGSAGQWVTIDLVGGDMLGNPGSHLDTYLHVLRAGQEVASDDDSGGNLNSRVVLQLPVSGAYVIRVTTYGGDARLGSYALSLRPGQDVPPPVASPPPPGTAPEPAPAPAP